MGGPARRQGEPLLAKAGIGGEGGGGRAPAAFAMATGNPERIAPHGIAHGPAQATAAPFNRFCHHSSPLSERIIAAAATPVMLPASPCPTSTSNSTGTSSPFSPSCSAGPDCSSAVLAAAISGADTG